MTLENTFKLLEIPPRKVGCEQECELKSVTNFSSKCLTCTQRKPKLVYPEVTPLQLFKIIRLLRRYNNLVIHKIGYSWGVIKGNSKEELLYNILKERPDLRNEVRDILWT